MPIDIVSCANQSFKILSRAYLRWLSITLVFAFFAAFTIPSPAQTYTVLSHLGTINAGGGTSPLIQGFDGNFYGASRFGGANNNGGVIYKVTPDGVATALYSFCAQPRCSDGSQPLGLALGRDGNFYGSTFGGGVVDATHGGYGTAFKMTPKGVLTTLTTFCGTTCRGGFEPTAVALAQNGSFFGSTGGGGSHNRGTIFKMTTKGVLTTVYNFCPKKGCPDGASPLFPLLAATNGDLYGTTNGETYQSTFFKLTPTGLLTVLHTFCVDPACLDGADPMGAAVEGTEGNFYGTTYGRGAEGGGTIYQLTPQGEFTALYSFCGKGACPSGTDPATGLTLGSDGNFYGTTMAGGDRTNGGCGGGCGTIFQFTPQNALTTLYTFCPQPKCLDGADPETPLAQGTDGNFYGVANAGGNTGAPFYKLDMGLEPFVKTLPSIGRAGAVVIILGNNLTGTTEVAFNGASAVFKVVSSTEISAKVPPGASTGKVTVTRPSGTLSSNVTFTVP
jgi:uncharacterized repeat protein (TIGR03803 family)